MDYIASQRDPAYRVALRAYERALRSRNLLLKAPSPRWRELQAFEEAMLASGRRLRETRAALVQALEPFAASAHHGISGARENLGLEYVTGSGPDFAADLEAARAQDARLRQTSVGPHRDDLGFFLNGLGSDDASEGQQRATQTNKSSCWSQESCRAHQY